LVRDGARDSIEVEDFPFSHHNLTVAFHDLRNCPHKRAPPVLVQQRDLIHIPD
jgi:hypothetical protein